MCCLDGLGHAVKQTAVDNLQPDVRLRGFSNWARHVILLQALRCMVCVAAWCVTLNCRDFSHSKWTWRSLISYDTGRLVGASGHCWGSYTRAIHLILLQYAWLARTSQHSFVLNYSGVVSEAGHSFVRNYYAVMTEWYCFGGSRKLMLQKSVRPLWPYCRTKLHRERIRRHTWRRVPSWPIAKKSLWRWHRKGRGGPHIFSIIAFVDQTL